MDERAYARYMADVAYFMTRMEQNPNSKYFMPIALAYNKMEKYDNTIELCRKAVERFPSYCPVKTLLAEAYIYKGEAATAKPLLFDVITEDPENYKALKLLGMIYRSTDETGEALKYFKAAYIRAPEDEDVKHAIEDLGGSVSSDDLFAEFMKKNQDALWSNTDERSYTDIDKHIRSAEVIMTDLVADTKIADNLRSENTDRVGVEIPDISAISDAELDKLLSDSEETTPISSIPQQQEKTTPIASTSSANMSDAISDDELNKLFTSASSSITQTAASQSATTNESVQKLEKEIESSDDYSVLESILDTQATSDRQETIYATNMEISDVMSVLESTSGVLAEETATEWDKSGAFSKTSSVENVAESFTPFTGGYAGNDKLISGAETQKSVPNTPEINSSNPPDASYSETFVLDEEALNSMQGFSDGKPQEGFATQTFAEGDFEKSESQVKKTGKIIEDFTVLESDDMGENQAEGQPKPPESIPSVAQNTAARSATEFKLEDMIGDDREDREDIHVGEEDIPARDLGEAVPFTQQDILDEILSTYSPDEEDDEMEGLGALPDNDRYGDKERTVEKLLQLQSRLDKFKKG